MKNHATALVNIKTKQNKGNYNNQNQCTRCTAIEMMSMSQINLESAVAHLWSNQRAKVTEASPFS